MSLFYPVARVIGGGVGVGMSECSSFCSANCFARRELLPENINVPPIPLFRKPGYVTAMLPLEFTALTSRSVSGHGMSRDMMGSIRETMLLGTRRQVESI